MPTVPSGGVDFVHTGATVAVPMMTVPVFESDPKLLVAVTVNV